MKISTFTVLALALALLSEASYSQLNSFSIYFHSGVTTLDEVQAMHLDSLLYAGSIRPGASVSITGYADEPGTTVLNKSIAVRRATAVKAYLLSSGIENTQIVQCTGVGNLIHTGEDMHQRRVDILLGNARPPTVINAVKANAVTIPASPPARGRSLRDLKTMKPGDLMVIENLQFKVSTNVFEPESLPILKELADVLQDFPGVVIRLEGHICCGGKTDSSKRLSLGYELSLSRSQAVLEYLVTQSISSSRLSCTGFGFSRPKIFPERNQQDSYINRRVEIRVVSNK